MNSPVNTGSTPQLHNSYTVEKTSECPDVSTRDKGTKRSLQDDDDTAHYPKALKDMFGALKCELCGVEANSTLTAYTHYKGKQHRKKVEKYLTDNNITLDTPTKKVKNEFTASTCELCNVVLTSELQSLQHYSGKAHKRKLANRGESNKIKVDSDPYDRTGRFGIGKGFYTESAQTTGETKATEAAKEKSHFCSVCNVFTTSEETLATHMMGSKHQKKLAAEKSADMNSLAKYRTPSDYYYCPACDISANSADQFLFHIKSKKHVNNKKKVDT